MMFPTLRPPAKACGATYQLLAFGALAAGLTLGCGSREEALPEVAASEPTSVAIAAPPPAHAGTVIPVGDQFIEVRGQSDGRYEAYVVTPEAPIAPQAPRLTLRVSASDGAEHDVRMRWNRPRARYLGRLRGVTPIPGPIVVTLDAAGGPLTGQAPLYVLVEAAAPPPPAVIVERPARRSRVVVERPRADIEVRAPRPPSVDVVLEAPAPPSVSFEARGPGVVVERRRRHRRRRRGDDD